MNSLSQLKLKGLVLGPFHVAPPDDSMSLRFEEISPESGNLDQFKGFIKAAHMNGKATPQVMLAELLASSCFSLIKE